MRSIHKTVALSIVLIAAMILASGCTRRSVVSIGSHRVTISRHGFAKKFHVNDRASEPTFDYAGVSTDGRALKVFIQGDNVKINGVDGRLRPGDAVLITDDGVAVNQLDYGQTAKYLQENNSNTSTTL